MDVSKILDCNSVEEQDLVSQYVGRKLSPEEAEAFEEHYFGCDRCWAEVQAATELRAAFEEKASSLPETSGLAGQSSRVIRGPWRTWAPLAAAAGIAVAVGLGLFLASRRTPGVESLARAASQAPYRSVEARLAGPFRYLPRQPVTRGASEAALPLDLRRAALDAQKQAEDGGSPKSLHAAGVAHLLLGEYDQAIERLEEALSRETDPSAQLLSDLAAAYYTRGEIRYELKERDRALGDFDTALKMTQMALKKDPSLAAALFNHALILESQQFQTEAAAAWRRYLQVDPTSEWAEEARRHLARLIAPTGSLLWEQQRFELEQAAAAGQAAKVERLVAGLAQPSRLFIQDEVLPAWADAFVTGRTYDGSRSIAIAREVGTALARTSGDLLLRDAVGEIDRAARRPEDTQRVRQFADGYREYGRGRVLFKRHRIEEAIDVLVRSNSLLSRAGSAFTAQVRIVLATSRFYQSDFTACEQLLDTINEDLGPSASPYPSVVGQLYWLRGLVQISRGYPAESLVSYRIALEQFQRLNETENLAAAHTLLAENLQYLGNFDEALYHRGEALALLNGVGASSRLHTTIRELAEAALARGYVEIARVGYERVVSLSREHNSPVFMADALLFLSLVQQKAGDLPAAIRTAREAKIFCQRIDESSVRSRTQADLDSAEALLWRSEDPNRALRCLTSAADYFSRVGNHSRMAEIYLERGLLQLAAGQSSAGERDFVAGISELEAERARIPAGSFRLSYFESGKDLFEELITLLARRGDALQAFSYAERSKARALLDQVRFVASPRASSPPLDGQAILNRIPRSVALVEYRVLPESLLVWLVQSGTVKLYEVRTSAQELQAEVEALLRSIKEVADSTQGDLPGAKLYEILIRPFEKQLRTGETLVIVPDKALYDVPFAALQDSRTRRYLIQDHKLALSPSATFFTESLGRQRRSPTAAPRSILVVENPTFDQVAFPRLRPLAFAAEEAARIIARYPVAEVQSEADATKRRFLERAPAFEIVHFAGHAVINEENPSLSTLLFAPDGPRGESGLLYAHEIAAAGLTRTRLVVLAACNTSRGQVRDVEGVVSIARAFLGAGAPAVLATLWEVDDETTAAMLKDFHGRLAGGDYAAEALRAAQLAMLEGVDPTRRRPAVWAPLILIGWL